MQSNNNQRLAIVLAQPVEYNTSSMIRTRNIMNALSDLGYKIICFSPYGDIINIYYSEDCELRSKISVIHYGAKISRHSYRENEAGDRKALTALLYSLYKRYDLFGSSIFCVKYRKKIAIAVEKCDIILTFSDPKTAHILGGYIKKKNPHLTYIQQWGDPMADDITGTSKLPYFLKKWIEKKLLARADKICYVSPVTMESQKLLFPELTDKIYFTPTPCEKIIYNKKMGKTIKIGYVGSYHLVARNIIPFYNAAKSVPQIQFEFIGDSELELEETGNIKVCGRQPHHMLEEYIKSYDVLVCLMNHHGTQIPGKIFNYAGTDKEILVIQDGEYGNKIKTYFEKYNRFVFVDNKEREIIKILHQYLRDGIKQRTPLDDFMPESAVRQLISIGGI